DSDCVGSEARGARGIASSRGAQGAAQFHLPEDALARHLLQHFDGLVDIVTRLCMRRSSSIERLMGPDDQGARATGARIRKVPVPMAAEERTNADVRNRPADGRHRCQLLRYVAGFWAALRTSQRSLA